ncbi:unnamed protein product [Paramecium pentaurelia]|uniref:PAS domain-containing protein n=1 Tax=Paramecium pentaurelia TaxID=43138 RepID=A0A8S1T9Y6_9CILI|nr:unnamed protein product [Paramecium pentaurelia]
MKGQLDDEEENENLIETEQKGLDYFLTKVKVVIFKVLFVLAKEEKADDQMIYFYILTSLDYVQMHSFPFNNKILYIWKADSFLTNILNFVNVFSISTYVPNLSYFALLVSVYICLSAILLIILNIIYVSYSFSQNKFKFMWPVYVLRQVAFYFVTVFFLPITETLTSILQCYNDPITNEYVIYGYDEINVQCWQGWHIFHALITLLFMLIFVLICAIVAYAFFEPGMTSGNRTARQDSNGEVAFIINKVTCQVLYCFLGKNESWILVLTTFTLSAWLFKEYNFADPIYDFEVGRFYSIISSYYFWANVMLVICKVQESAEFSGGLIAWVIGLPFIVSIMLTTKKSKVDTLVRAQNKFSSGEDVWIHIRYVLQLISQADSDRNSYMLLIGYIEKHKETCKQNDCYFKQRRKTQNSEQLDDLKRGLIIELDKMFRLGLRKFWSSASLRIFYALFLMERRNNKNDAYLQFNLVSLKSKPKFFQQFITYRYMKIIKDKSDDVVDAIANQNNKSELYSKMKMAALYYKTFWNELKEDQPNLVRLMHIGAMITKVSNQVMEKHQEMSKKNSLGFADLKTLANFYYQVFNDSFMGQILKNQHKLAKQQLQVKVEDEDLIENNIEKHPIPFLQVCARKSEIGKIINLNSLFTTFFGYQKEELRGKSINILMPKVYAEQHDNYLIEFFDNMLINMQNDGDYPRTYIDQEQLQFIKHRNGYIIPFIYRVSFNIDSLQYLVCFKSDPTFKGQAVFIIDQETTIIEMSSGSIQYFDIELRHIKQIVNLNTLLPDILTQNGKQVQYHKSGQNNIDSVYYFQCSVKEIEITQIINENLLLELQASKKLVKSGYWLVKLEKIDFPDVQGGRKASTFISNARNLLPNQSRQSIQITQRQSISITQKLIPNRANQTVQSLDTLALRIDTNFEYDQNLVQFLQDLYTEQRYEDYKDMINQQEDQQTQIKLDYGLEIRVRRLINNQILNIDEEKEQGFLKQLEEEEEENSIFRNNNNQDEYDNDQKLLSNMQSQIKIRNALSQNHRHNKITKFCIYANIWIDFIVLITAMQYYFCQLNFEGFTSEIKAIYQINNEIINLNLLISRTLDLCMDQQFNFTQLQIDIQESAQLIINFDNDLNQEFYRIYFDSETINLRMYEKSNQYEDIQLSLESSILLITSVCLNLSLSQSNNVFQSNSIQIILFNYFNQIHDPLIKISQILYQDVISQVQYPDLNLLISLLVLFIGTTIGMIKFITLMLEIKIDRENVIFLFLEIPQNDVQNLSRKVDKFLKFYNEDLKKLNNFDYDESSDEDEEQQLIDLQQHVDGQDKMNSKAIEEDNQYQLQLKRRKIIQKYRKSKLKGNQGIIVQFLLIALLTLVFAVYNIISSANEKSQIQFLLPQFYQSSIQIENYGYYINLYKLSSLNSDFQINNMSILTKIVQDQTIFTGNQLSFQNFAKDLLNRLPDLRNLFFQTYYGDICSIINKNNDTKCYKIIEGNLQLGIYNVEQYYLQYFRNENLDEIVYNEEIYEIDQSLFYYIKQAVSQITDFELDFMTNQMSTTLTIQLILVIIYILILELVVSVIWLLFLQKLNIQINLNMQMLNMIPMKVVENNRKIRMFIRQCIKKMELENT